MEMALQGSFGRIVLGPVPLTIGKAADNQLIIADPKVSAHHAEIRPAGQGYSIADVGSTNGTYINGQKLSSGIPRMLNHGDTVRVGDTTITYVLSPTQQSGNIPVGGSTLRADYAYQQSDNPYQYPPAYPGYAWESQRAAPLAPPPVIPALPNVPPPYTPAPQPAPTSKNLLKVLVIALVIAVLVGGVVGTGIYLSTRPHPVISVTSKYNNGSTPLGATGTTFHISGQKFSGNSTITLLLDGAPIPGNSTVQSDANGNINADLPVTSGWTLGNHTFSAKDASNYSTQSGVAVTIVQAGQANTPGPNGAPPDDMSFMVNITISPSNSQQTYQETLIITGKPDPAGGSVCESIDNGQPNTYQGKFSDGTPYTRTSVYTCSGVYKGGKLSYTEMDSVHYSLPNNVTCATQGTFVIEQLDGTFSSAKSIGGTYNDLGATAPCSDGSHITLSGEKGTWTGQVQ